MKLKNLLTNKLKIFLLIFSIVFTSYGSIVFASPVNYQIEHSYQSPGLQAIYDSTVTELSKENKNTYSKVASSLNAFVSAVKNTTNNNTPFSINFQHKARVAALVLFANNQASVDKLLKNSSMRAAFKSMDTSSEEVKTQLRNIGLQQLLVYIRQGLSAAQSEVPSFSGTATNIIDLTTSDEPSLLASVMFSLHGGKKFNEASLNLRELRRYPKSAIDGSYGNISKADSNQEIGTSVANYIKVLYENDYLQTSRDNEEFDLFDFLGEVFSKIIGLGSLTIGVLGEAVTNLLTNAFSWIGDFFLSFNIGQIFSTKTGERVTGGFQDIIEGALESANISASTFTVIRNLVILVLIVIFIFLLMRALSVKNKRQYLKKSTSNLIRIFVILLTVPLSLGTYSGMKYLFNEAKNFNISTNENLVNSTLINVNDWAATMNLSLAPINPNGSFEGSYEEVQEQFKPTYENIERLNSAIYSKLRANGQNTSFTSRHILSDFSQNRRVSINEFLGTLSSLSDEATASAVSLNKDRVAFYTSEGKKQFINLLKNPYFLTSKAESNDYKTPASLESGDIIKDELKLEDRDSSHDIEYDVNSKMNFNRVRWDDPSSYLYTAIPAGSLLKEHSISGNYTAYINSSQGMNPQTGEQFSVDKQSDAEWMEKNKVSIAAYNKEMGAGRSGSVFTPSTQSVLFLLQSTYHNENLSFKSSNAAPSDSGLGTNTGRGGVSFNLYSLPKIDGVSKSTVIGDLSGISVITATLLAVVFIELIRQGLLGALLNIIKNFFRALFTGDPGALFAHMLYYIALALIPIVAIILSSLLTQLLFGIFKQVHVLSVVNFLNTVPIIGMIAPIALSMLTSYIITTPSLQTRSGKVSLASFVVITPLEIVDGISERIKRWTTMITGIKSKVDVRTSSVSAGLDKKALGLSKAALGTALGGYVGYKVAAEYMKNKNKNKKENSNEHSELHDEMLEDVGSSEIIGSDATKSKVLENEYVNDLDNNSNSDNEVDNFNNSENAKNLENVENSKNIENSEKSNKTNKLLNKYPTLYKDKDGNIINKDDLSIETDEDGNEIYKDKAGNIINKDNLTQMSQSEIDNELLKAFDSDNLKNKSDYELANELAAIKNLAIGSLVVDKLINNNKEDNSYKLNKENREEDNSGKINNENRKVNEDNSSEPHDDQENKYKINLLAKDDKDAAIKMKEMRKQYKNEKEELNKLINQANNSENKDEFSDEIKKRQENLNKLKDDYKQMNKFKNEYEKENIIDKNDRKNKASAKQEQKDFNYAKQLNENEMFDNIITKQKDKIKAKMSQAIDSALGTEKGVSHKLQQSIINRLNNVDEDRIGTASEISADKRRLRAELAQEMQRYENTHGIKMTANQMREFRDQKLQEYQNERAERQKQFRATQKVKQQSQNVTSTPQKAQDINDRYYSDVRTMYSGEILPDARQFEFAMDKSFDRAFRKLGQDLSNPQQFSQELSKLRDIMVKTAQSNNKQFDARQFNQALDNFKSNNKIYNDLDNKDELNKVISNIKFDNDNKKF